MDPSPSTSHPASAPSTQTPVKAPPTGDQEKLVEILSLIRTLKLSLPRFLELLFAIEGRGARGGNAVSSAISSFLNAHEKTIYIDHILDLIYNHRFSSPKRTRPAGQDITPQNANVGDYARYRMQRWAIGVVSSVCLEEAEALMKTRDNPLRMSRQSLSWAILHGWDIEHLRKYMQSHAPTIFRLMNDISKKKRQTGTEGNVPAPRSRQAPEATDTVR